MISISIAHNEARLNGTLTFMEVGMTGGAVAHLRIYNGVRPANGGAVTTLLVDIPLDNPPGTVTPGSGVLNLTSAALPLVAATGTASWARCVNAAGAEVFDCDVSDTTGTGEVQLPSTSLFAGGKTSLVSAVLG